MSVPVVYAVAHTTCGHVACVYGTRSAAESARFLVGVTTGQGVAAWVVRAASDTDMADLLQGGKSCAECRKAT